MARLPQSRIGEIYKFKGNRKISFSFWPVQDHKRPGRKGIQERLYSNDPWSVIKSSLNTKIAPPLRVEAEYFIAQSKDYYDAATLNRLEAAKPLLLYYCALNLVKALLIVHGSNTNLDNARHGLEEKNLRSLTPINHELKAYPTNSRYVNIFYELHNYLTKTPFASVQVIPVKDLFKQIILGHRILAGVEDIAERFVHIKHIDYVNCAADNTLWTKIYFDKEDVSKRLNRTIFLRDTNLIGKFREVKSDKDNMVCFEQTQPVYHSGWPSDALQETSDFIKENLWTILLTSSPYVRYYAYLRQPTDIVLPQILSIYGLFFYLGSVTRYRPSQFQELMNSKYGGFISEFVNNQITQFLYMIASEFERREVSKPSVI